MDHLRSEQLMQDFMTEVAASSHFFHDDIAQLTALVSALQKLEARKEVAHALAKATEALHRQELESALSFLLYAQRLSPSNRLLTLFIGDVRLALRLPEAAEPFHFITQRNDWRGAWYRLAYARSLNNQYLQAAADLHETLTRNAPLLSSRACKMASDIAVATSSLGWCGVNNAGTLFVGGDASAFKSYELELKIDGNVIKLGRRVNNGSLSLGQYLLPENWIQASTLKVTARGVPLIGSPIKVQSIARTEGFVSASHNSIQGWTWFPGEPDATPIITVRDLESGIAVKTLLASSVDITDSSVEKLAWPRRFELALSELPQSRLQVLGPHGKALYGSPLNPWGTIQSGMVSAKRITQRYPAVGESEILDNDQAAEISIAASHQGISPASTLQNSNRMVLVVIPVYRGFNTTVDCINSVLRHKTSDQAILVISDASPDDRLVAELKKYARKNEITLLIETVNRGFPGTVNIGLRRGAMAEQDVILLNSDTIVTFGWVDRLRQAVYQDGDVGTATPMSNAATILSYPYTDKTNSIPTEEEVDELASICAEVNGNVTIDIPTAHGFCMYIKHECLVATGILRDETFAQGYGEENDFCMRARHLGWRHVAVPGSFVGHIEGQSFAAAKDNLVARNITVLNTLHPGYDALISKWQTADPIFEYRRRIDHQRWIRAQGGRPAICFVTHDREGGVLRHVQMRAKQSEKDGLFAIICEPALDKDKNKYCVITSPAGEFPNLKFRVDTEMDILQSFLRGALLSLVEVHHFVGHDHSFVALATQLGVPYDVHIHDYSWFCPRITLTSYGNRYCGEPNLSACVQCISDLGSNFGDLYPRMS